MASNGRLPDYTLARIPGSGPYGGPRLRKDVARAYIAMHNESVVRFGISMALAEGTVGRAYRSYARQVLAKKIYGSNAATPGFSNHGWGINVDLMSRQQRWVIDKIGAKYGFSKRWSDASWEWWHITYQSGHWNGHSPYPVLRRGSRNKRVKYLQYLLLRKGYKKVPRKGEKHRGHFNAATQDAVKAWQRRKGLKADGIVGPATWRTLVR